MIASQSTKSFTLALAALIVLSTLPTAASGQSGSATQFDLELDKALSGLEDELSGVEFEAAAETAESSSEEPIRVAQLTTTAVKELWSSEQTVLTQTSTGSSSGKKGSWLKRKWWIPVLAAVVVGVSLSDGDGDNNDDDSED